MPLDNIITHIQTNCPVFIQVADANGQSRETIDTSKILYDLVKSTFNNLAYPLVMPENTALPALAYQLVESNKIPEDTIDLLQSDRQVIYFQTNNYPELVALRKSTRDALISYNDPNNAGVIEVVDESIQYLETYKRYECAMDLYVNHLIGANQAIPAALVYHHRTSGESDIDGCGKQMIGEDINVIIVCKKQNISTANEQILTALIGYQETEYHFETEHIEGLRIETTGELVLWKHRFKTKIKK